MQNAYMNCSIFFPGLQYNALENTLERLGKNQKKERKISILPWEWKIHKNPVIKGRSNSQLFKGTYIKKREKKKKESDVSKTRKALIRALNYMTIGEDIGCLNAATLCPKQFPVWVFLKSIETFQESLQDQARFVGNRS